jgi:8-hydroxy-5-deazaflavin:NADPH oxidoreductase
MTASISILGSGNIGAALARRFAARSLPIGIANSRSPETLKALAAELGNAVVPLPMAQALKADMVILAVPFVAVADATRGVDWSGRIVVDATNPHTVAEIRRRSSTADVAACVPGAAVVKAFNTLPAAALASEPQTPAGRRVLFVSGYEAVAIAAVRDLIVQLGFSALLLGSPDEGGLLQQRGGALFLAQLISEPSGDAHGFTRA